jgi:hypothetical protein
MEDEIGKNCFSEAPPTGVSCILAAKVISKN